MYNTCDDNRFQLIEKYKAKLIESTNIADDPEDMAAIDSILFRFWQMDWLDKLEKPSPQRWIPCSERWPEEYTVVLVSDGEKIGIAYRREYLWYHEEYLGNIAAWMPLPEPYKGE